MSAQEIITEHLDLWTGAVIQKSSGGRSGNGKIELKGIKKLRDLILELAIRGKLARQDPNAEPANVLLERIFEDKERLFEAGKIKKPTSGSEILEEEKAFNLPAGWCWARVWNVSELITSGSRDWAKYFADYGAIFITMGNLSRGDYKLRLDNIRHVIPPKGGEGLRTSLQAGDLVVSITGDVGNLGLIPEGLGEAYINQHSCLVRFSSVCRNRYFAEFLRSPFAKAQFNAPQRGVKNSFRLTDMGDLLLPVPPLEEQHRIVQKVDELMALCDRLEQQTSDQLEAHETLVDTLLGTLTQSQNATELADNWARLAAHFDTLFTTEQSIEKLKQTILQLAVMGRLVEQDERDGTSQKLVLDIEQCLAAQVEAGRLKPPKKLPEISHEEVDFEIPKNWIWIKFGRIASFINGDRSKNYPNRDEYVAKGVPWINTGHIEPDGTLSITDMNFITRAKFDSLRSGKIEPNDLVYCLRGATFGKTAFVTPYKEGAIASSLMIIRPFLPEMRKYIFLYLISPFGRKQIFRFDNGSAQPNLSANSVTLFALPLPPKEEQKRIVQRVDELMGLCDQLKESIEQSGETRRKLAESLVEGAIS